jgi:PBSX family phage terminase large subunit
MSSKRRGKQPAQKVFTDKQETLISEFKGGKLKRINVLQGSVRSGKTWISLVLWAFWVAIAPKDGLYLMVGKTMTTLKNNCLIPLQNLVGSEAFTFNTGRKEGRLFGRIILLEGAGDARSEGKIRGLTLAGAYVDEITMVPKEFFIMLLDRLSVPGARLFGTTNPDSPTHWFKVTYLDHADDLDLHTQFYHIDDNTTLDPKFIAAVKAENMAAGPLYYDRFITGLWKRAEGIIYRAFADAPLDYLDDMFVDDVSPEGQKHPDRIDFGVIGVDYGGAKSQSAFVLTGFTANFRKVRVLAVESHKSATEDPEGLAKKFVAFCRMAHELLHGRVYKAYCDSAETILTNGLRAAIRKTEMAIEVTNAWKTEIVGRIRLTNTLIGTGRFRVLKTCAPLIESLKTAVWDEDEDTDVRLDDLTYNVDVLDAMEYTVEPYAKYLRTAAMGDERAA